jgi:protein required for attachment to host cells
MVWWIVIADAARARIFSTSGWRKPLHLEQAMDNPLGRARPQDLVTDDPGRHLNGMKSGQRSTWAPANAPDVVEEQRFAHRLGELLRTALARRQYESLAILAPPQFLGFLREAVGPHVRKHVARSIAKDLTAVNERDLPTRLGEVFLPPA